MQEIELKPVIVGDKRTVNPKHLIMGKIEDKRRNLERIQNENMQLLKRLSNVSPTYNHLQWKRERRENEKLIASKCKYPHIFRNGEIVPQQQSQTFYGGGGPGIGESQKLNRSQNHTSGQDLGGTQSTWQVS